MRDRRGFDAWAQARALGPDGELESRWVAATCARIGVGDGVPWRHYVGRLAGQWATASDEIPDAAIHWRASMEYVPAPFGVR